MVDGKRLLAAFRPNAVIEDPAQFAGRRDEIESLVDALLQPGACPMIHGYRGAGKSSLAVQIQRIAVGDVQLLEDLGLGDRALAEGERFVPLSLTCTDDVKSKDQLVQRLINQASVNRSIQRTRESLERTVKSAAVSLKVVSASISRTYGSIDDAKVFRDLSKEEQLTAILEQMVDRHGRVLLVIDELDRVKNTRGFASLIKSLSSEEIKFLLVGVGHSVSSLLHDHKSLSRLLVPVEVPPMTKAESLQIIEKAVAILNRDGQPLEFLPQTAEAIAADANGFPWFVHTLALEAAKRALKDGRASVGQDDYFAVLETLSHKRFHREFYDTYQLAVRDSLPREKVLRLFAKWDDTDIPTSDLYPMANMLAVANPSTYTKHLTEEPYGRVLVRPPGQTTRAFRFANPMFKQYVNLRRSIYRGVRESVDTL